MNLYFINVIVLNNKLKYCAIDTFVNLDLPCLITFYD